MRPARLAPTRWHAAHGILGVATPVGTLGGELEWMVADELSLSGGIGVSGSGPQIAVMPRYQLPVGTRAWLGLGLGLSGGPYTWKEFCLGGSGCTERTATFALWGNAELSGAWQWRNGMSLRIFLGVGQVLNPGALTCDFYDRSNYCKAEDEASGERLPSFGLAYGGAFGPR